MAGPDDVCYDKSFASLGVENEDADEAMLCTRHEMMHNYQQIRNTGKNQKRNDETRTRGTIYIPSHVPSNLDPICF